jgi:hypothetical protein
MEIEWGELDALKLCNTDVIIEEKLRLSSVECAEDVAGPLRELLIGEDARDDEVDNEKGYERREGKVKEREMGTSLVVLFEESEEIENEDVSGAGLGTCIS